MICCICKKEIVGFDNNPDGAINEKGEAIVWNKEDRCCSECNNTYVVPGRWALLTRRTEYCPKVMTHE